MYSVIYVENAVADHPRSIRILKRYPSATLVRCERYGEVFNPRSQNFRLQKRRPALILARKHDRHVLPCPEGFGMGAKRNYYFSHMLNCLFDCRYCFLQGMFKSANHVVFVNFEDFEDAIDRVRAQHRGEPVHFFSGYDCDSLALEPVTGFCSSIIPLFRERPDAVLELRTKSTQIRELMNMDPIPNCVIAFSFTPYRIADVLEHGVPGVAQRIAALRALHERGWPIGLRLDPLIHVEDYRDQYRQLIDGIFANMDGEAVHSVSIGAFRLPKAHFRTIKKLYPDEPLFAAPLQARGRVVEYKPGPADAMFDYCLDLIAARVPAERIHSCGRPGGIQSSTRPGTAPVRQRDIHCGTNPA